MPHIYTAATQPATGWIDNCGNEPLHGGFEPDEMIFTLCCKK